MGCVIILTMNKNEVLMRSKHQGMHYTTTRCKIYNSKHKVFDNFPIFYAGLFALA